MLGSIVFLVLAPGTVAGLVPWLITRWQASSDVSAVAQVCGVVLVVAGLGVVVAAFFQFVVEGRGTPAPVEVLVSWPGSSRPVPPCGPL